MRREQQLLQAAVRVLLHEQARQGQHGSQQRRHPQDARRQRAQLLRLRAHREREEAAGDHEEEQARGHAASPAPGQREVVQHDGEESLAHACP